MAPGYVANGECHGEHGEPKGKSDTDEANSQLGERGG
jgi:hypothetical protein